MAQPVLEGRPDCGTRIYSPEGTVMADDEISTKRRRLLDELHDLNTQLAGYGIPARVPNGASYTTRELRVIVSNTRARVLQAMHEFKGIL